MVSKSLGHVYSWNWKETLVQFDLSIMCRSCVFFLSIHEWKFRAFTRNVLGIGSCLRWGWWFHPAKLRWWKILPPRKDIWTLLTNPWTHRGVGVSREVFWKRGELVFTVCLYNVYDVHVPFSTGFLNISTKGGLTWWSCTYFNHQFKRGLQMIGPVFFHIVFVMLRGDFAKTKNCVG